MDIGNLNRVIREMCQEVQARTGVPIDWRTLDEESLIYEMAICVFSSQVLFETAVAMADRLRGEGLFNLSSPRIDIDSYEMDILEAFSHPVQVIANNRVRVMMPRFRNRLAFLLASTVAGMHCKGFSLRELLRESPSSVEARVLLVDRVWGFGPKQASLFLRRIGFDSNLAVLDVHILDFLRLTRRINPTKASLTRLSSYEKIECTFREVASEFGHSVGCLDLATWVTMRVAKREAYLCV